MERKHFLEKTIYVLIEYHSKAVILFSSILVHKPVQIKLLNQTCRLCDFLQKQWIHIFWFYCIYVYDNSLWIRISIDKFVNLTLCIGIIREHERSRMRQKIVASVLQFAKMYKNLEKYYCLLYGVINFKAFFTHHIFYDLYKYIIVCMASYCCIFFFIKSIRKKPVPDGLLFTSIFVFRVPAGWNINVKT